MNICEKCNQEHGNTSITFSSYSSKESWSKTVLVDCNTPLTDVAIREIFGQAAKIRVHRDKAGATIYNKLTREVLAKDVIIVSKGLV